MKSHNLQPKDFETQLEYQMYTVLKAAHDELESVVAVDELEGDWMDDAIALTNKLERKL